MAKYSGNPATSEKCKEFCVQIFTHCQSAVNLDRPQRIKNTRIFKENTQVCWLVSLNVVSRTRDTENQNFDQTLKLLSKRIPASDGIPIHFPHLGNRVAACLCPPHGSQVRFSAAKVNVDCPLTFSRKGRDTSSGELV